jgi:hypothetical protein
VIVNDLHVIGISVLPDEADPILVVDADAVLTLAIAGELPEPVGRRTVKVVDGMRVAEHPQLAQSNRLDVAGQLPRELSIEDPLSFGYGRRPDHGPQSAKRRVMRQPLQNQRSV